MEARSSSESHLPNFPWKKVLSKQALYHQGRDGRGTRVSPAFLSPFFPAQGFNATSWRKTVPFLTPLINRAAKKKLCERKEKKRRTVRFLLSHFFPSPSPYLAPLSRGEIQPRRTHPLNEKSKKGFPFWEGNVVQRDSPPKLLFNFRPILRKNSTRASTLDSLSSLCPNWLALFIQDSFNELKLHSLWSWRGKRDKEGE